MAEPIWILTTTSPDREFDIFTFNTWLHTATLAEL